MVADVRQRGEKGRRARFETALHGLGWCRGEDLNLHGVTPTST